VRHTTLALSVAAVAGVMTYGMVLLVVLFAYRKAYGILGKSEPALRLAAERLAGLKEVTQR
jgi:hypothetical protein